jgi:hypothetical protein
VYVQSFPQPGSKKQISTTGGTQPVWKQDGKELYYLAPDGTLMAASIRPTGSTLEVGVPVPLFKVPIAYAWSRDYSVAPNGRFLVKVPAAEQLDPPITVILK